MDLIESGAIFNFKPFNPQTSRNNGKDETLNSSSRSTSRTNSRFEELFLASPRAQELVSTMDQSLSFTKSRSRIISPSKQQSFFHESFPQTPSSSSNPDKTTNNLMNSGLVNMLGFFRSGPKTRSQENALFSPMKISNYEEDSLRTQVTDVINKLRTPINGKSERNDDDSVCVSLNADSGYDDRQVQSYCDSIADSIVTRSHLRSSNEPQQVSAEFTLELREENNEGSVPEPAVTKAAAEDVKEDVEYNQQSDPRTENIESTQKQSAESAEEDMDCNVSPELDIADIPELTPADGETKEPVPAESAPSQVKLRKKHHLIGWYIKAIETKDGPSIIVEGQRREDTIGDLWHSTAIVNRVSPYLVETKSKSQYVLEGEMLTRATINQGFSIRFAEAFTKGFPSKWQQLVKEHFCSGLDDSPTKVEQPSKAKKTSITKKQPSVNKKPRRQETPKNAGFKPIEVELKRTSSGRLIKPPLAWWRGQRILTDSQHNLTAIEPGGEEHTGLSVGLYDFDLKLPKNSKTMMDSIAMVPKVAKYNVTTKTTGSRENQKTTTKGKVRKSRKKIVKHTETSSNDGSESESSDSTSYTNKTKDSSEIPSTSQTESDASSFPKVMKPKHVSSEESWKPSDSDSTAKRSSDTSIPKSKKPQALGNTAIAHSRKQRLKLSMGESADEEEEDDDDEFDMVAKDKVKRNISFSDDDHDFKSSQQKFPQKKGSFTYLSRKENNKTSSNHSGKPLKEMKVVLEKHRVLTRSRQQIKDEDHDSDSCHYPNDNDESDAVKSSEDVLRSKALVEGSSKFRKPEGYVRGYKKKDSEAQSCTESSSEENTQQRRSLRKGNQEVQRINNSHYKDNNPERKGFNSHVTRTRDTSRKHIYVVEEEEEDSLSSSDKEEAQAVAEMLSSVRQKKIESQAREDSDSDSPIKRPRKQTARKKKNHRSKAGSTQDKNQQKNTGMGDEDDVDERDWKENEIYRLSNALHSIPLSTPRFWQKVSESVETRTAQECQLKYDEQLNLKPKKVSKLKEKQPTANQKVVAITGGVGTIKRKRALRQLVQQNNNGYEDDIFESTPYKNTKKKFKFFNDEKDEDSNAEGDDDDDNDGDDEENNHMDFKTPSSRTPSSRYRPLGPAVSSLNTPGSDLISPSLLQPVNRGGMDHYIHRMKQVQKGVGHYRKHDKMKVVKTSTPKKKASPLIPNASASIFDVQEVLEHDSDEDTDYYWSDE